MTWAALSTEGSHVDAGESDHTPACLRIIHLHTIRFSSSSCVPAAYDSRNNCPTCSSCCALMACSSSACRNDFCVRQCCAICVCMACFQAGLGRCLLLPLEQDQYWNGRRAGSRHLDQCAQHLQPGVSLAGLLCMPGASLLHATAAAAAAVIDQELLVQKHGHQKADNWR